MNASPNTYILPAANLDILATGDANAVLAMAEIARGERGHYARSVTGAWGRMLMTLTDDAKGEVWTAHAEPSKRVAFGASQCRSARRTCDVVSKHLPIGTSPDIAADVVRVTHRAVASGYIGVRSEKLHALIVACDVEGIAKLRKPRKATPKPAATPEPTPEPTMVETLASRITESLAPEPTPADAGSTTVTVIVSQAEKITELADALESLRKVGVSQEDADMLIALVMSLPIVANA